MAGNLGVSLERRAAAMRRRGAFSVTLSGSERQSKRRLTGLYFGSGANYDYLLGRVYDEWSVVEEHPRGRAWGAGSAVNSRAGDVDLVLVDLPWPYHQTVARQRFLESPAWLQQRLSLPASWDEVRRAFRGDAKNDLRRIANYGLEYQLTNDTGAANIFYNDMYLPHLRARFGDAAEFMPQSYVTKCIRRGTLLQVTRGGAVVGAAVLFPWGRLLQQVFAAIPNDIEDHLSRGVFGALYYYTIVHGFERGFSELDLTGTRPLLNDGLFRFKRKWGAGIRDGWIWGLDTLLIRPMNFGPGIQGFLAGNPLVVRGERGLVGKVLLADDNPTVTTLANLVKTSVCRGLHRIQVSSISGFDSDARDWVRHAAFPVSLIDLGSSPNPAESYCRS